MNNKEELTKYLHLIIKVGVGVLTSILIGFAVGVVVDRKTKLKWDRHFGWCDAGCHYWVHMDL